MRSFVLIPSPLLGPSSMRPLARTLESTAEVVIADLTRAVEDPRPTWDSLVFETVQAAATVPAPVVLVGHSGAGAFLPLAADTFQGATATVFVDAVVPSAAGVHRTSPEVAALLDDNTHEGRLTRWLDWWPAGTVDALLPDPAMRTELLRDMPRAQRSLFDQPIAVPPRWTNRPCVYVRLSAVYDADLAAARRHDWPCATIDAHHLTIVTQPALVADGIETTLHALARGV